MNVFDKIKGGLIVSCQALETEPLYSSKIMARMAFAAKEGGEVIEKRTKVLKLLTECISFKSAA